MDLNNYMIKSLNKIANKHNFEIKKITNIENLTSSVNKDGIKKHLLLRNVLVLEPINTNNYSWRYKLHVQFNAHGSYRIIENKYIDDWIPSKLMYELSCFISTNLSIRIKHDQINNYLIGIHEKKNDFYYYARRYFNRDIKQQDNEILKYITKDMVETGYLYGDFYSNYVVVKKLSKELYDTFGDAVTCFFINLNDSKEKQPDTVYCIDCGHPYYITIHPESKKQFEICYKCNKIHEIRGQ